MGVNLKDIIQTREIDIKQLSNQKIGIDAYNWSYQFLSTIRLRTGELLKNSKGTVTSHLIGLFTRTTNLLREDIKPCYVWDGKPPEFKLRTIEEREKRKEIARIAFEKAETEEEKRKYAMQISRLTPEMIEDANKILDALGVPHFKAPSEGEAQIAHMVKQGTFQACASQDWDALVFGTRKLIRNLSVSGKKRIPRTKIYKTINPEIIDLQEVLNKLGVTQEQLIMIAMLIGTDYAPGVKGYGPKKSLALVKKEKTLKNVLKVAEWDYEIEAQKIFDWFLSPKVTDKYDIKWGEIDVQKLMKLLVDKYEFSQERVEGQIKPLVGERAKKTQTGLDKFF